MKIQPENIDIVLEYVCPECGFYHFLSPKRATIGHIICEYCDHNFDIQPIAFLNMDQGSIKEKTIEIKPTLNDIDMTKIYAALSGLGLDKQSCRNIIQQNIEKGMGSSEEELLKACISSIG